MSVSVRPGAIALTLIFSLPSSFAITLVEVINAVGGG